MATFLRELKRLMFATYGERFEHRVAAPEACAAWEGVWRSAFDGKTPGRCRRAIEACLNTYPVPFTPSHFAEQYAALPRDEPPRQQLPPPPMSDRDVAQEYLDLLKHACAATQLAGANRTEVKRTERDIATGRWTPEMEARFQRDLRVTGFGQRRVSTVSFDGRHCCYPGCDEAGVVSASTNGSSTWYCARHWRA